jgi:valyl-tRNA synthetase
MAGAVDTPAEHARLERELAEAQSQVERLEKLLASEFVRKAPAQVVAKEREKLTGFRETADKIKAQLQ